MRLLSTVFLSIGFAAFGFTPLAAQCGNANGLGCSGSGIYHRFDTGEGLESGSQHSCKACPLGQDCHPSCTPSEEEEEVQLAYAEATHAMVNGDLAGLFELQFVLADYLVLNEERGSLQLLSCTKEDVVGSILVTSEH